MIPGVRGRLITASFARTMLPTLAGTDVPPRTTERAIAVWAARRTASLGPASSVRAIVDVAVVPLLAILDLSVGNRFDAETSSRLDTTWRQRPIAPVIVVPWQESLDHAWRLAVARGIGADARWCFSCNGRTFRIVDSHHTWARHYLEFDLDLLGHEREALRLLWCAARGEALGATPAFLDRLVEQSARHGIAVCRALGDGVLHAVELLLTAVTDRRRVNHEPMAVFEQCLTVVYRVLFLLFAEARGLVPIWHPVYRDRYSIETIVTTLLSGRAYRGIAHALHAISRLAHAGCAAGELTVTAFNGRLFAPSQAVMFDGKPVADDVMGRVVMAVSTTSSTREAATTRVSYADLDVEQLGAVYEHLLDHDFPSSGSTATNRASDVRKSSGTFYTPRAVTAFLVRQTLEPLIHGRSADEILRLRIVDPAMGSGAFLVETCRFLAAAVEDALIREGRWHPGDVATADRMAIRREISLRCLYGVDVNPMAVQLARLSIWLATLASDKPLTFLDHHLVAGDSLIGATPDDVRRRPSRVTSHDRRLSPLPLLDQEQLAPVLEQAVRTRLQLALEPDDSAAIVREKERTLARLQARSGHVARWSRLLDLWCAGWFGENGGLSAATYSDLAQLILQGRSSLPDRIAVPLLRQSEGLAVHHRFLHWPIAFPEIFADEHGQPGSNPGFDAVIGNPPWDMIRADSGDTATRTLRRREAQCLTDFVRESGIYRVESRSHVNRYQLFVERSTQLARHGGRIGLVLPSGVATDAGTAALRRFLFERAAIDSITGIDNRSKIFPIHRSVRFALLTCTCGQPTTGIQCRFGITAVEQLETSGRATSDQPPLVLTRHFLLRVSGMDDQGIPELATASDLRIVEKVYARVPWLGSTEGWNVHFGRELNASDDRHLFVASRHDARARPVLEGKHLEPFRVCLEKSTHELSPEAELRVGIPRRSRLAFRDVASATNRLTLIAAIVPAQAVTTHTLFCLKEPLLLESQYALCALLNSFVANYIIRLRVNTHVTTSLVSRLPVPFTQPGTSPFTQLGALARKLMGGKVSVDDMTEYAELQALVARLYGLDQSDFERVLSTFPLISDQVKAKALAAFTDAH